MGWLEEIIGGGQIKTPKREIEKELVALEKMIAQNKWTSRRWHAVDGLIRSIFLSLHMEYMRNPGGNGLINAATVPNSAEVIDAAAKVPEDSIYSRASKLFGEVVMALSRLERIGSLPNIIENIQWNKEMVDVFLKPDLSYRRKLDQIGEIGDRSLPRLRQYGMSEVGVGSARG